MLHIACVQFANLSAVYCLVCEGYLLLSHAPCRVGLAATAGRPGLQGAPGVHRTHTGASEDYSQTLCNLKRRKNSLLAFDSKHILLLQIPYVKKTTTVTIYFNQKGSLVDDLMNPLAIWQSGSPTNWLAA